MVKPCSAHAIASSALSRLFPLQAWLVPNGPIYNANHRRLGKILWDNFPNRTFLFCWPDDGWYFGKKNSPRPNGRGELERQITWNRLLVDHNGDRRLYHRVRLGVVSHTGWLNDRVDRHEGVRHEGGRRLGLGAGSGENRQAERKKAGGKSGEKTGDFH